MSVSRKTIALLAGSIASLLVYAVTADVLPEPARRTAAIAVLMATWWMTAAIPLPVTALLPLVLFPLLGVLDIRAAAAPYASSVIFLFLGGFILGLAMEKSRLHKRIALGIVGFTGTDPRRLVGGFMLAAAALSMWISNTATAIMLLPVAISLIDTLEERDPATPPALATALLLGIAYGTSIGGLGSLLGSPPNIVLANYVENELGGSMTMLEWMRFGIPSVIILLPVTWWVLVNVTCRLPRQGNGHAAATIDAELASLGEWRPAEKRVLAIFLLAVFAWLFRQPLATLPWLAHLNDTVIAVSAAIALFLVPSGEKDAALMDWQTAERLPWGILLLFGGGLSLATAITGSGLDQSIASAFALLGDVPLLVVILAVVTLVIFVTELSSNTATANTFIPILAAAAIGLAASPMPIIVAAALASSCAFMLPVATPPNAIVFGSQRIPIETMIRAGWRLNLLAIPVLTAIAWLLGA